MYNMIIADDDPFILSGIQAMLDYRELQITIVGTAANGSEALEMIHKYHPDLVITDVKMPEMTGLELVKACKKEGLELPIFLILTDYDEAPFIREALSYHVAGYLIKLELTSESLTSSLNEALQFVNQKKPGQQKVPDPANSLPVLHGKFYIRLLHNLFDTPEEIISQGQSLGIELKTGSYVVAYMTIQNENAGRMSHEKQLSLYNLCLQTAENIFQKYIPCHTISLDLNHFATLFFIEESYSTGIRETLSHVIRQIHTMLYNYYTVLMTTGVGCIVSTPEEITLSYQDAKKCSYSTLGPSHIIFSEDHTEQDIAGFNLSLFKADIQKAYSEYDTEALRKIISDITGLFHTGTPRFSQALDMAGNFLHLSITLLYDGEKKVSGIFSNEPEGYHCLYQYTSVSQIINWFRTLGDGLCTILEHEKINYKKRMIQNICQYIDEHPEEKLSLATVAKEYYISTGYLSTLFTKYAGISFVNYVNLKKIEAAKRMILEGNMKLYEISDKLGYENAFYFSRVFKKVEGISPREYMNQKILSF